MTAARCSFIEMGQRVGCDVGQEQIAAEEHAESFRAKTEMPRAVARGMDSLELQASELEPLTVFEEPDLSC